MFLKAILAVMRLHFPDSLCGRFPFASICLATQFEVSLPAASLPAARTSCQPSPSPGKDNAATAEAACPPLQLGQGDGGTGTLPVSLFPSLPLLHALSSSQERLEGGISDLCWTCRSCWDPNWQSPGMDHGGGTVPMEPAATAWHAGARCSVLCSCPGAGTCASTPNPERPGCPLSSV